MASPWNAFGARRSNSAAKVRPADGETRPMWLSISGSALAVVVSIGGTATVLFGFRLPFFLALPLLIGWVLGQSVLNSWTIEVKAGDPGRWRLPGRRTVFTVLEGVVVAAAAVFWFIGGVGTSVQASGAAAANDLQQLRDERADLQSVLARPVPDSAGDPETVRLDRQVTATANELQRADHDALCELDGTCGTRVAGRGLAYYKKVEYRDSVKRDLDKVSAQLEARKAEVTREAGLVRSEQGTARTRVTEIDRRLAAAVPPRDQPAGAAVNRFFNDRGTEFLVLYVGVFAGFFVLDWILLALLLRFGHRRIKQWDLDFGTAVGAVKRGTPWHRYVESPNGAAAEEDEAR